MGNTEESIIYYIRTLQHYTLSSISRILPFDPFVLNKRIEIVNRVAQIKKDGRET